MLASLGKTAAIFTVEPTMSERRRGNRFVIPETAQGAFRMMQDVFVEQINRDVFAVVGDAPVSHGEDLLLELPRGLGDRSVVSVEIVDSHVVHVGDVYRHRTILRVVDPLHRPEAAIEQAAFRS